MRGEVSSAWLLGLERGELLAAQVGAAARHHHGGIPAQDAGSAAESVQPPEFLLELLIGRQRHGDPPKRAGILAMRVDWPCRAAIVYIFIYYLSN